MYRLLIALLIILQLTACSKKGGNGSDGLILTGQLMDTGIQGLTYKTPTQSGTTDKLGHFKYKAGETISFSVGNLPLVKNIQAKEFMTILDMDPSQATILNAGTIENGFTIHTTAESTVAASSIVNNLTRFLELLDNDKKADKKEGIVIPDFIIQRLDTALAKLPQSTPVDFTLSPDAFAKAPSSTTNTISINTTAVNTSSSSSIPVVNASNSSWANILLDNICFYPNVSAPRDIKFGTKLDSNKKPTGGTIIFKQTTLAEACLNPAPINTFLNPLEVQKTKLDGNVATLKMNITNKEKAIKAATAASKPTSVINALQAELTKLKNDLIPLEAQQTTLNNEVTQLDTLIKKIADGKRRIADITKDSAKTYLLEQSALFTSTISGRIALSPYALRYPASDTSIKSIKVFPVLGTKSLQGMEVKSANENIISIDSWNMASKTAYFHATGSSGEETEVFINFKLSGDYRWFRKTVRVLLL